MKTILRLLPYIKPYRNRLLLTAVCNILLSVFTIFTIPAFIPFFQILFETDQSSTIQSTGFLQQIKLYFQTMIQAQGKSAALIYVCVFLVIVLFFKNLFRYLALFTMSPLRTGIIRDIREKLYNKFLDLPLSYFSNERKGDLMSRITNDVTEIEWTVMTTIEAFFREPLILLGSLIFMLYVSPQLTLVVFILMIFIGYIIGGASRKLKKQSQQAQDQLGLVNSTLDETIGGIRIIKSFTAESFMMDRFKKENETYRKFAWEMLKRRDLS
ncbi:MAG: ABC transporter ATP-binding protein, partial [Saprospiraceae bacterium]|nr:ABC transporter ATP-binding protein [Saprospiraceae bacterium]